MGGLVACGRSAPPQPPPAPQVTVAAAVQRTVEQSDEFTGRLQAVDAVEIRPRVSGFVQRVLFAEGKEVNRGDVLFEIDPRPYQTELDHAQAELQRIRTHAELAGLEVERAKALVARQAISREEYDSRVSSQAEAAAAVRSAEAAVAAAALNLEWTRVRAPISGRISKAEVTAGNLVQSGPPTATLLTTIVSLDPIYLAFETDEQTYLKYGSAAHASALPRLTRTGTKAASGAHPTWRDGHPVVYMGLADEAGYPHEGALNFVDNQLDPSTGTIRARAVFANPDHSLAPGLFARVKLMDGARVPAVLIRDDAVGTDQDKKFVLVLNADGTAAYRPVQLGSLVDGLRVITSGLAGGERVLVNGIQRVRPGMKVKATEEAMVRDTSQAMVAAAR